MTSNQIAARNVANEEAKTSETRRSNREKERETRRHNRNTEAIETGKLFVSTIEPAMRIGARANHPEWYSKYPALLASAASLAWGAPYGSPIERQEQGEAAYTVDAAPNFCIVRYAPTLGVSTSASSVINTAAQKLYSWVRHANSGSRNYENADLYLYLLAVTECYSFRAEILRMLRVLHTYSAENLAYGRVLTRALGFDYDDVSKNIANIAKWLSLYTAKVKQFAIPGDFSLSDRRYWMNSIIAKDNPVTAKSQAYAFVPSHYYKFTTSLNEGESGAGALELVNWHGDSISSTSYKKASDIMSFGDALIAAIYTNEDIGVISGDIQKAYTSLFNIADEVDVSQIVFADDRKTLEVFENATIIPGTLLNDNVYQVAGEHYLKCQPQVKVVEFGPQFLPAGQTNAIVVTDEAKPDPAYTTSITSLTHTYRLNASVEGFDIVSCGSEIAISVILVMYSTKNGTRAIVQNGAMYLDDSSYTLTEIEAMLGAIDVLNKFKHAPEIRFITQNLASTNYRVGIFTNKDIDNYVVVSASDLISIHNNMLMSMLTVGH